MHPDEIKTVAQAITDAHANKPGNDYAGRIDDAKTVIAAFDAIMRLRAKPEPKAPKAAAPALAPVEPTPAPDVAEPTPALAPELDNVTPIKSTATAKTKGKKA